MSTVLQARTRVRRNVRDGNDDTTYTDVDVDNAVMEAGRRFCRETRCLITSSSVAITAASTAFPVTAPLALGFAPDRIIDAFLAGKDPGTLRLVSYPTLNTFSARDDSSGTPELLAFPDASSAGILWPTPDESLTAKLAWFLPFTSWTAGSGDSTTLNLPEELLDPVIRLGAPAMLKFPSAEDLFKSTLWQLFESEIKRLKNAGQLGAKEQLREPTAWETTDPRADRINAG